MELRQLRYVEAVARHRHFTRAAEELHVAQSALSHQIRRLEAELGTELFERTSRTVIVTEAGEAVADRARSILAGVAGVREEVDQLRGLVRGRVSVGATLPAGELDVPRLLVSFSEAFPGIEVDLHEGTGDMQSYLAEDRVDAAFSLLARDPPADIEVEHLSEEEVVAAFPAGRDREQAHQRRRARPLLARHAALRLGHQAVARRLLRPCRPAAARIAGERRSIPAALPGVDRLRRGGAARVADPPRRPADRRARTAARGAAAGDLLWRKRRHQSPAARAFIDFASRPRPGSSRNSRLRMRSS